MAGGAQSGARERRFAKGTQLIHSSPMGGGKPPFVASSGAIELPWRQRSPRGASAPRGQCPCPPAPGLGLAFFPPFSGVFARSRARRRREKPRVSDSCGLAGGRAAVPAHGPQSSLGAVKCNSGTQHRLKKTF